MARTRAQSEAIESSDGGSQAEAGNSDSLYSDANVDEQELKAEQNRGARGRPRKVCCNAWARVETAAPIRTRPLMRRTPIAGRWQTTCQEAQAATWQKVPASERHEAATTACCSSSTAEEAQVSC
jgi:hypothetical protein